MEHGPKLIIHTDRLLHNMQTLVNAAHAQGVQLALVSQVVCAHPAVIDCINLSGCDMLADSRVENLRNAHTTLPKLMLRIGMPEAAEDVVLASDVSLESEIMTILALEKAAAKHGRLHRVILMIDLGDLREGVFFRDWDRILKTAQTVKDCLHLELYGTGTNLTCYGSVLPDQENLGTLVSITERLRKELSLPIPIISGGNSTSLQLLLDGTLPQGINHLRLGESVMCGMIPGTYTPIDGCYQDVFRLDATIAECKTKPSYPIGTLSRNAFGETVEYVDKGIMQRAIAAVAETPNETEPPPTVASALPFMPTSDGAFHLPPRTE